MTDWIAQVKAPQGGPIYTHDFESTSIKKTSRDNQL